MNAFFVRFLLLFAAVFAVIFLLVWFYLSATAPAQAAEPILPTGVEKVAFEKGRLEIRKVSGETVVLRAEFATTPRQLQRGLMFRDHMAQDEGMLFDFGPPRQVAMWMKNTLIALDMLFIDAKGQIVHIVQRTTPHSQKRITAPQPVRYVLELVAGGAAHWGLAPGDRLILEN